MKKLLCLLLALAILLTSSLTVASALADEGSAQQPAQEEVLFPQITSIIPAQGGVTISFTAYPGASKYRLFIKKTEGIGWTRIADTADLTYTRTGITAYTTDTYTVRALDANGNFISEYDRIGYTYTYLPAPQLKSVSVIDGGVKLTWNPVKGAQLYRVFVKNGSGWKGVGNTDAASYIDRSVISGNSYTYTVRVLDADRKTSLSYYLRTGITARYVDAPQITACTSAEDGVRVSWDAVSGADRYRLFVKNAAGWTAVGTTAETSLTHRGTVSGIGYTYTVRAIGSDGKYVSSYDAAGTTCRYVAAPSLPTVTKTAQGVTLSWDRTIGALGYRVYRRTFGSAWTSVGDTVAPSYRDRGCPKNTLCSYAVCALNADRQPVGGCSQDAPYYDYGVLANGAIPFRGTTLYFKDGHLRQGYVTLDGKTRYYNASGVLMKDGVVGSEQEGYRYADKDGVVDMSFTGVVEVGGVYRYFKDGMVDTTSRICLSWGGSEWNILSGTVRKVVTEEDKVLYRAIELLNRITDAGMTKEERLLAMWNYCRKAYVEKNPRIPHYKGMDWPIIYANDMLINGVGNCMSYGAEFCYLAKAIGYKDCYACNSGGHGWAEIDGLVYDVEWSRHVFKYSYYALSYDTKTDQNYKAAIAPGLPWMHIRVCADYD